METAKIDFLITWVDGADPIWHKEKLETLKKQGKTAEEMIDNSTSRYRDWDILKYWFRGVEKFAPWVNQIHFVTYGHVPDWLNEKHSKLHIVKHEDFIPQEFRPTFSSHPIEWKVLAKYFDKRENMKKQPGTYFHPGHAPFLHAGAALPHRRRLSVCPCE